MTEKRSDLVALHTSIDAALSYTLSEKKYTKMSFVRLRIVILNNIYHPTNLNGKLGYGLIIPVAVV